MKLLTSILFHLLQGFVLSLLVLPLFAQESDILEKRIHLPKSKGSIYQLLNLITDRTDYLFIYDSKVVNNEQKGKISKGNYTTREAILRITGNNKLGMRIIGRHILLYIPSDTLKYVRAKPIQYLIL